MRSSMVGDPERGTGERGRPPAGDLTAGSGGRRPLGAALVALALASLGAACAEDGDLGSAGEVSSDSSASSASSSSSATATGATTGASESATATAGETRGSGTAGETTGANTTVGETTTGTTSGITTGSTGTTRGTTTGRGEPFCGDGVVDRDEECDDGNDDDFDGCTSECMLVDLLEPPPMEWTYYEIEGTSCLNGATAGFAVSHNADSSDVMIYLEGGGACFSDACDFTAFNLPFVPPIDGIFSRSSQQNPVRAWTMVYVPYCTGDIHAGDNLTELGGQLRHFRGYRNITRYLEVLVPSFPAQRVLLTGISAGGFGAALNAAQVADAYGDGVELTVVDDSGPPLSNAVIPPCLQATFREVWGLDNTVLALCPECAPEDFASDLLAHLLANYPAIRFALFSNTADQIIRTYMGAGWGNGQHNNCGGLPIAVPIQAYAGDLSAIRAENHDAISTFYLTGLGHTVLRIGYYITSVQGKTVPEWLSQVLSGQIIHVGP